MIGPTFVGLLYQISTIISEGDRYDPLHFYSSQRKLFSSWEHFYCEFLSIGSHLDKDLLKLFHGKELNN